MKFSELELWVTYVDGSGMEVPESYFRKYMWQSWGAGDGPPTRSITLHAKNQAGDQIAIGIPQNVADSISVTIERSDESDVDTVSFDDALEEVLASAGKLSTKQITGIIKGVFTQIATNSSLQDALIDADPNDVLNMQAAASAAYLERTLSHWKTALHIGEENYWQKELENHPWLISNLFSAPVFLFKEKAYLGGKGFSNQGGKEIDFLLKNPISQTLSLVEIKTPATPLIGCEYRTDVYAPSVELAGSVVQVQDYLDKIQKHFFELYNNSENKGSLFNPRGMLIIGNLSLLKENHRSSFELFRAGFRDISIITFDELLRRGDFLVELLRNPRQ